MKSDLKVWLMTIAFMATAFFVFFRVYYSSSASSSSPLQAGNQERTRPTSSIRTDVSNAGAFRVAKIHDGDTCDVIGSDGIQFTIRLEGIDAPELAQESGHEAKQLLVSLIVTRTVSLAELGRDKYGRYLAQVHCGETWINKEMLLRGAAWTYLAGNHFDEFKSAEALAKSKRLGLWSSDNPRPPWEARK